MSVFKVANYECKSTQMYLDRDCSRLSRIIKTQWCVPSSGWNIVARVKTAHSVSLCNHCAFIQTCWILQTSLPRRRLSHCQEENSVSYFLYGYIAVFYFGTYLISRVFSCDVIACYMVGRQSYFYLGLQDKRKNVKTKPFYTVGSIKFKQKV